MPFLIGNGELFTAFFTTRSQYPSAIGAGHPFLEAVFVTSLTSGGLECAFHDS